MKKLFLFLIPLFSWIPAQADYLGNLFDPITGNILYLRVYQPTNKICVQVNSANYICWTTTSALLLLEDGGFFLLEDGTKLELEQ